MKIFRLFSLLILMVFILISCSNENGNILHNPDFTMNISVKDINNNPVPDLHVYVRNNINRMDNQLARPCCIIAYTVAEASHINCSIYDLNNRLVSSIVDDILDQGCYSVNYNTVTYPNGDLVKGNSIILRYALTATDTTSNEILFEESQYMLRYTYFYGEYKIGTLDNQGQFATDNSLYLPSLYNISMDKISPDGYSMGELHLLNSFEIVLINSETDQFQSYDYLIEEGDNYFDLIWDENKALALPNNINREVTLTDFWLEEENNSVLISWITESELDNYGWNIFRCLENDFESAAQINSSIVSGQGHSNEEIEYSYNDDNVESDYTYYYWIQSLDLNGETDLFGPQEILFVGQPDVNPPVWSLKHYPNPFN